MIIDMHKLDGDKIRVWQIEDVPCDDGTAKIINRYGVKGGKIVTREKYITEGKNIGKSNETTPATQARQEAIAKARKQLKSNYILSDPSQVAGETGFESNGKVVLLPMLAKKFEEKYLKGNPKINIQAKLDGFRCCAQLVNGKVEMTTRKGDLIETMGEIKAHLAELFKQDPDIVLDGEIYVHGWTFQRIASAIKKRREDTKILEYHVFDVIDDQPFIPRYFRARKLILATPGPCKIVDTINLPISETMNYLEAAHRRLIANGYEGTMVRVGVCDYDLDKRSSQLLKKKDFQDAEYIIVGGEEELLQDGNNGIVYTLKDLENPEIQFNCRPRGTMAARAEALKNLAMDMGKKLTVRFQEFSEDGVPRFPVGLHIRELD